MIVIGGKNSANTIHIAKISKNILPETYHIETAEELDRNGLMGKSSWNMQRCSTQWKMS